jgi:protein CpxP
MSKSKMPRLVAVGVALAIGLFASTVDAQGRPPGDDRRGGRGERLDPAQRLERRVSFLTEQLQLDASQQTQVRSILTQELSAMQALRPQARREDGQRLPDAARDSVRAQMQQIHQRTEQRVAGVLNAQQRTKYEELQKQRKDQRGRGRGGEQGARGERRSA